MSQNTQKQHPLGTGFSAASTAADVVAGIDLSGTHAVVTGGHAGLGLETTRALSAAGASVTVGSRDPDRAAAALARVERVEVGRLDLLDPSSIDAFAARLLDTGRPVHILVNNAGIMSATLVRDARGYEAHFATNHLGHVQLTKALLPALRAAGASAPGARVVSVSSGGHRLTDIRWDDPHFRTGYDAMLAYGQSKTANILFAVELDRRWADDGIRGYALHPGQIVSTGLAPWLPRETRLELGLIDASGHPVIDPDRDQKTPQQGAATSVFAATSPLLAGTGGVFLINSDIAPLDDPEEITHRGMGPTTGVMPYAVDPASARRLWDLSDRLLLG